MTAIQRLRCVWTGFPGGPGLTTLYFTDAAAAQADVRAFWSTASAFLPPDVTVTVQAGGDVIEDTTGSLTAIWAGSLQSPVVGTGAPADYAAPVGVLVRWETLTIRAGSRLRGRSYLVPCISSVMDAAGAPNALGVSNLTAYANTLVAAQTPNMLVWQRPRVVRNAYTDGRGIPHKALVSRVGSSAVVVSASVPREAVVLRSRRD